MIHIIPMQKLFYLFTNESEITFRDNMIVRVSSLAVTGAGIRLDAWIPVELCGSSLDEWLVLDPESQKAEIDKRGYGEGGHCILWRVDTITIHMMDVVVVVVVIAPW